MFDPATISEEKKPELSTNEIILILENLFAFETRYGYTFQRFFLTGGDPLLRPDWEIIVQELRGRGKDVFLMGNPDTLSVKTVEKLVQQGIKAFQLSIDGLREVHDSFRGSGSFDLALQKIALLRDYGIPVNIMFTLFPNNARDLIPLLEYIANHTSATSFSFDFGTLTGSAVSNLSHDMKTAKIAALLSAYHDHKNRLQRSEFKISEKSNFHRLVKYAQRQLFPVVPDSCSRLAGCLAGWNGLCLLSNGAALACRRIPVVIGKMPEQSFEDIFLGHPFLKKLRRHEFYEKCNQCHFYPVCRGCPAIAHSISGNSFTSNPYCFRHILTENPVQPVAMKKSPSLSSSYNTESGFIKENRNFLSQYSHFFLLKDFQDAFFPLLYKENDAAEFKKEPYLYLEKRGIQLNNDAIAWLMFYFAEARIPIRYDISAIQKNLLLRRHASVRAELHLDKDRLLIELNGKMVSASPNTKKVFENLFAREAFTAGEVLSWDPEFDWNSVQNFLHTMLEELILCVSPSMLLNQQDCRYCI
jgi:radical SAM protein with 4Fe4S-binding SPASM domain